MKKFGVLFFSLVLLLGLASLAGAYEVYSDPPLPLNEIQFNIDNFGPGTINTVEFGLFSPYVVDNIYDLVPLAGVTVFKISVAGEDVKFKFNFTSFTPGNSFSFKWDPDIVGDDNYAATLGELANNIMVTLFATEGKYCGLMEVAGDHLEANLCCFQPAPAPLPVSLLLFGSGLLGMVGCRLRKT